MGKHAEQTDIQVHKLGDLLKQHGVEFWSSGYNWLMSNATWVQLLWDERKQNNFRMPDLSILTPGVSLHGIEVIRDSTLAPGIIELVSKDGDERYTLQIEMDTP